MRGLFNTPESSLGCYGGFSPAFNLHPKSGVGVSAPAAGQRSEYGCAAVRFPGHRAIGQFHQIPGKGMGTKELHGRTGDSAMRNFLLFWARGKPAFPGALGLKFDPSLLQHCPEVALLPFPPCETR